MNECRIGVLQLFIESIADDWTHGGLPAQPIPHVSSAVNHTLWHMVCVRHPKCIILLSKITNGLLALEHPQYSETCSDCLISKLRKPARSQDPGFKDTVPGQGLALDVGFVFQKSKDLEFISRIVGINDNNTYCVINNFCQNSSLVWPPVAKIPVTWLHILLTIAPKSTPVRIVHLDLGGETGKNATLQTLLIKHGYLMEPTSAGSSSQNGLGERHHQTIGNAVRVMLYSAQLSAKYWEYAVYVSCVSTILSHMKIM
jgi:hypothetical protein